ncbi:MAG: c-type cytochrome [Deltaproteobacteria bacterium]|nr:c-type cytochrome [Deltaproteobacteria bacterium]MCL5892972.1 c-type cytochrome [Deltaproteobacteria bacterium]
MKARKGLTVLFTALFLLFIGIGLYGCAQKPSPSKHAAETTPAPAAPAPSTTMAPGMKMPSVPKAAKKAGSKNLEAAAMKIINAQGCTGCHIINGKGGSIGPSLSKEGTKGRSIHWLEVQINTPKVHNPNTMMPNHALKPAQLETVAEYLESLK